VGGVLADSALWLAAARSLGVAVGAGLLATTAGWGLLLSSRELRLRRYRPRAATVMETVASLVLVVPPLVIGTGLFALLSPIADVFALGIVLVIVVNAVMGLPYVIRTLGPPLMRVGEQHDRLCGWSNGRCCADPSGSRWR
jgi:thiamine transport system permease protein